MMMNSLANVEKAEEWGPRSSPMWTLPMIITDMDFADDIALISEDKANEFLLRVGSAAASVGLHINEGKIRVTTLNMEDRSSDLQ